MGNSKSCKAPFMTDEERAEFSGYDWPFENFVVEGGGAKGIGVIGTIRVSFCLANVFLRFPIYQIWMSRFVATHTIATVTVAVVFRRCLHGSRVFFFFFFFSFPCVLFLLCIVYF